MNVLGVVDVPMWLLLLIATIVLLYLYGCRNHSYYTDLGIPAPKQTVFLGNFPYILKVGFLDAFDHWHKTLGDVYGVYFGSLPMTVVHDVEILKEILVKQFTNFSDRYDLDVNPDPINKGLFFVSGATWKRQRTILSPTFTAGKMRLMTDHIAKCSQTLSSRFEEFAKTGKPAEVKDLFGDFTMEVIASTAFSIQVDSQNDPNNEFIYYGKKIFSRPTFKNPLLIFGIVFPSLMPYLKKIGITIFPKDIAEFFNSTMRQMIAERKQEAESTQVKHVDFLQLMLNAESEEIDSDAAGGESVTPQRLKGLSNDEIVAQGFLFFLAGYQTTRLLLQYCSYVLATNTDVQEKVIQEITEHIGEEKVTYENISKLQYMENVVKETLRLHPSVIGVNRKTLNTTTINGFTFPKDSVTFVPIFHVMRDERNFPEPLEFRPERWENKSEINPVSFLAFGFGPRQCIGMRLAMLEVKVALVEVLRKMKFVRLDDTPDFITFQKDAKELSPVKPIILKFELHQNQ